MTSPSPTCWLYLNCEDMTGKPAEKCPNRRKCRVNAKHSDNRYCQLPYTYQHIDPRYDQLFDHEERHLEVHHQLVSEDAIEGGWMWPERLFYSYQYNTLLIGEAYKTHFWLYIPPEAAALGFAKAEVTPYALNSEPGKLIVTVYEPWCTYPKKFLDAGWAPALKLPYYVQENDIGKEGDDYPIFKGLYVNVSTEQSEYKDAIAAGWYPPRFLPQYDDPDEGFDDEDNDWCEDDY